MAFQDKVCTKHVIIEGAGHEDVNGTYSLSGFHNARGVYSKFDLWESVYHTFSLFLDDDGQYEAPKWRISIVPPGKRPGAPKSISFPCFYMANDSSQNQSNGPPTTGWATCLLAFREDGEALDSLPTLTLVDAAVLPGHSIPTTSTVQPIAAAYESMVLSEDFSDVKLVCGDNVTLPAHKVVLAATSSYFNAAFSGPWNENEKGEVNISHSSKIVMTVLKLLYTGVIDDMEAVAEEPVGFIAIAAEFDLPWLREVAEKSCFESVNEDNLKDIWQTARLYDCDTLRRKCLGYAKTNAAAVLAHGGIVDLRIEDPASWEEFSNGIRKKSRCV